MPNYLSVILPWVYCSLYFILYWAFLFLNFHIISLGTRLGSFMFFPRKILCLGTLFSALPFWRHCIVSNREKMLEKSKTKLTWLAYTVRTPNSTTPCLSLKDLSSSSSISSFGWGQNSLYILSVILKNSPWYIFYSSGISNILRSIIFSDGPPCKDSHAIFFALVAFYNSRKRFLSVCFLILRPEPCDWSCQFLLLPEAGTWCYHS